jgi:hypothetical protein
LIDLDDLELIGALLPLRWCATRPRHPTFVPMGSTTKGIVRRFFGISAGDMKGRRHDQMPVIPVERAEIDPLGVAEEPSGLVVRRLRSIADRGDAKGDGEAATLTADACARWWWMRHGEEGRPWILWGKPPIFVNDFTNNFPRGILIDADDWHGRAGGTGRVWWWGEASSSGAAGGCSTGG